jgi:hypothetical protein
MHGDAATLRIDNPAEHCKDLPGKFLGTSLEAEQRDFRLEYWNIFGIGKITDSDSTVRTSVARKHPQALPK